MASSFSTALLRASLPSSHGQSFMCQACRRHQSSFRRQRKALRVKPDPAFLPSKTESQDHIIFNPPSSAPNVYHTPLKFLPSSDPRRQFHRSMTLAPAIASSVPTTPTTSSQPPPSSLPPPMRRPYERRSQLSQEHVEEMRRLRAEDPRQWTRKRLAEKFDCSQFFVSLCCCAPEIKEQQERELEVIKRKWGRRKTEAREDRQARKALWGRDG